MSSLLLILAVVTLPACDTWKDVRCGDRLGEACPTEMQGKWECDDCGRAWVCQQGAEGLIWANGATDLCQCILDDGTFDSGCIRD